MENDSTSHGRARVVAVFDGTTPITAKAQASDLRLVLVSDTHNVNIDENLFPEGDLLLHAGDHTRDGKKDELQAASVWLHNIAKKYTYGCVTIGGNHDTALDTESMLAWNSYTRTHPSHNEEALSCGEWTDDEIREANSKYFSSEKVKILQQEAVTIAGLTIFGSPYVPPTPRRLQRYQTGHPGRMLGFNREDHLLADLYAKIPANCDILMTHSPPHGILDVSYQYGNVPRPSPISIGSTVLANWISSHKEKYGANSHLPALHLFGHEHDSRGVSRDDSQGVVFVNGAAVDGDRGVILDGGTYTLKENFQPIVVDIRLT